MTTATQLYKRWFQAINKENLFKKIIKLSISSGKYGADEWRYNFKDGSFLVYRKLVKEFVI